MLCYAMLCYAILCCALLYYAMLCYAILCCAMLCYAMLFYNGAKESMSYSAFVAGIKNRLKNAYSLASEYTNDSRR